MEDNSQGINNFKRYGIILFFKTFQNINFILKVIWLICLYITSTWLVLGTLTSQQFQEKVNNKINPQTKKNYSVSNLISLTEQYDAGLLELKKIQYEVDKQEKNVVKMDKNLEKLRKQRSSIIEEFEELSVKLKNEFKTVVSSWTILKTSLENSFGKEEKPDESKLKENISDLEKSSNSHNDLITRLVSETNNLSQNQTQQKAAELSIIKSIQDLMFSIREHQNSRDLIKEIDDDNLKDLLVELRYLTNLKFHYLATMPNQLLTLILTLSMGALGSTIFLTKELFNPSSKNRSLNWYLFRPFLGMVTAIAIFVLVKSGQIVITYNTSVEQKMSEALNPFFVSFLAIISGLLSEHAYEKIYRAGKSFFDFEDVQENRWGVRLKTEIESQKKSIDELSKIIQTPTEVLNQWINEERAIPLNEQKIISAWLSLSMRELFTDIPPDKKGNRE